MGIKASDGGGSDWALPDEGMVSAVCCAIEDRGQVLSPQSGKMQHKCRIIWQIDQMNERFNERFEVSAIYTVSLHEKATLRRALETWRGKKFTREELNEFDLDNLLGVPCQVQIQHKITSQGRTFANVVAVVPLGKGMPALKPLNFVPLAQRKRKGSDPVGHDPGDVEGPLPF